MTTRITTITYASRGAVHGSNAYDLARVGSAAPAPSEYERVPAGRPEIRPMPSPKKAPGNTPGRAPVAAPKTAPRTTRKARRAYGISVYSALGFVVAAVLMIFVLLAYVRYTEVTNETSKLQTQLAQLNAQERKLKIAYENAFDVNQVERVATRQLGMSKPQENQIGNISATARDKVVVNGTQADSRTGESMGTFLASLVSYFR